ncbi:hypothetical protein WG66_009322, partial [Moniliophthora roreri]
AWGKFLEKVFCDCLSTRVGLGRVEVYVHFITYLLEKRFSDSINSLPSEKLCSVNLHPLGIMTWGLESSANHVSCTDQCCSTSCVHT